NEHLRSDELEKYDRVLDEFMADIGTTIQIACGATNGTLADSYAIAPLFECTSIEDAIARIRAIYRGRSIIPRVWYELARKALERVNPSEIQRIAKAGHLPNANELRAILD